MEKFNSFFIRLSIIAFLLVSLALWIMFAGPSAFDSGPVGVTVFIFVTLAIILTVINIGYRVIFERGSNEVQ